jgi:hypothetical protein
MVANGGPIVYSNTMSKTYSLWNPEHGRVCYEVLSGSRNGLVRIVTTKDSILPLKPLAKAREHWNKLVNEFGYVRER